MVSDHVYQFKFALLLDGHHVDEGLVEHGSLRQLGDHLGGLGAAWWWDVDLLGEPDVSVLQGKECVVGSHSDLREWREGHGEGVHIFTPMNECVGYARCNLHELLGGTSLASGLQGCCQYGQSHLVKKQNKRKVR